MCRASIRSSGALVKSHVRPSQIKIHTTPHDHREGVSGTISFPPPTPGLTLFAPFFRLKDSEFLQVSNYG